VSDGIRYTETDALIDTGAQRTVVSPEAVRRAGLSKINEADIRGVGGITRAGVYVASLQFPKCGLRTIEVIEVSCCELSHILYHCLLGRDVLSAGFSTTMDPLARGKFEKKRESAGSSHPKDSTPTSGASEDAARGARATFG
jgi:predicted aspartyl protease